MPNRRKVGNEVFEIEVSSYTRTAHCLYNKRIRFKYQVSIFNFVPLIISIFEENLMHLKFVYIRLSFVYMYVYVSKYN